MTIALSDLSDAIMARHLSLSAYFTPVLNCIRCESAKTIVWLLIFDRPRNCIDTSVTLEVKSCVHVLPYSPPSV